MTTLGFLCFLLAILTYENVAGCQFTMKETDENVLTFDWRMFWIFHISLYVNWNYGVTSSLDVCVWRFSLGVSSGYWTQEAT